MIQDIERLVEYIVRETGIDRDTVIKVLMAERRYYLGVLDSNDL